MFLRSATARAASDGCELISAPRFSMRRQFVHSTYCSFTWQPLQSPDTASHGFTPLGREAGAHHLSRKSRTFYKWQVIEV